MNQLYQELTQNSPAPAQPNNNFVNGINNLLQSNPQLVEEIEELRKVYTPPQEMMDKWDSDHRKYIEQAAWIKQMLTM